MSDNQVSTSRRSARQLFGRAFHYMRPNKRLAGTSVAITVLSSVVGLLSPWPLAILVDSVLGDKPLPAFFGSLFSTWGPEALLVMSVVMGLAVTLTENGLAVLGDFTNTTLDQRMVLDFRSDLFQQAQRLSFGYHDRRRSGEWIGRINYQAAAIGSVPLSIPPLVQSILTLVGMFVVAYQIHPQLALLSLVVAPFIYYSIGYYGKKIVPRIRTVQGMEMQSLNIVHESMQMLRVIVAFGREMYEYAKFRRQGESALDARVSLTVRQTMFSMAINVLTATGTALVLFFGGREVMNGTLTLGTLLVVMSYVGSIYQPLQEISSSVSSLQEQLVHLDLALELVDSDPDVTEDPDAITIGQARGSVEFANVNFIYEGRKKTLHDISFRAEAGQRVAIVGPTGAGKTTLVSMIIRFIDPKDGSVLIDDIDVRKLTLVSLRSQISIVLQEPLLFSGTISDNIRYGRLDATQDEIIEAAKAANAYEFISALPEGFETMLGERGALLSGGERQRISIARAFLKDSPILILDEPTSSIDSKTEQVILEAIDRLMSGRTTFMIAHRLSTIRDADLILVLNHGDLVEAGSRDDLIERQGLFRQLHDAQVGAKRAMPAAVEEDIIREKIARLSRALLEGDQATQNGARRKLKAMARFDLVAWASRALNEGTTDEIAAAVRMGEVLGLKEIAGDLLHVAVRVPDTADNALAALASFPEDNVPVLASFRRMHPARRPRAVVIAYRTRGPSVLPQLRALAEHSSTNVCKAILDVFQEHGDAEGASLAISVLRREPTGALHDSAVRLFRSTADRSEVRAALSDESPLVRAAAVGMIAQRPRVEDLPLVLRALADPDERVRHAGSVDIKGIGAALLEYPDPHHDGLVSQLDSQTAEKLLPFALKLLRSTDPDRSALAIQVIARAKAPKAARELETAVSDGHPTVRLAAVRVLGELRDKSSVAALRGALRDPVVDVRAEAVWGLSMIEDEDTLAPLLVACRDSDTRIRTMAEEALVRSGLPAVDAYLTEALSVSGFHEIASELLLRRGTRSLEPLFGELLSGDKIDEIKDVLEAAGDTELEEARVLRLAKEEPGDDMETSAHANVIRLPRQGKTEDAEVDLTTVKSSEPRPSLTKRQTEKT